MSNLYTMDSEQLERNLNTVKDKLIWALVDDGLIEGKVQDISSQYIVVIHTKGRFGKLFDLARGFFTGEQDDNGVNITVLGVK